MEHIFRQIMRYLDRMGPQEWALVMIALIVVGLFCMRGFGSRTKY